MIAVCVLFSQFHSCELGTHRVHITLSTEIVTNGNNWGLATHRVHITLMAIDTNSY